MCTVNTERFIYYVICVFWIEGISVLAILAELSKSQRKKRSLRNLFSLASPTHFIPYVGGGMDNRDTQYIPLVCCQRNFSKIWHFRCEFDVEKENLFWQQNILFVIFLFICMMYLLLSIKSRLLTIFISIFILHI